MTIGILLLPLRPLSASSAAIGESRLILTKFISGFRDEEGVINNKKSFKRFYELNTISLMIQIQISYQ